MLTSVSRAAARRALSGSAASKLSGQALPQRVLAIRPAPMSRAFSVSLRACEPAAQTEAKPKKKATTATKKKPAVKKPVVKKKKAAAKKKPVVKKKKKVVAKKKKPVVKKKVVLTDAQKENALRRSRTKVALLKEQPTGLPATAWLVYIKENTTSGPDATSMAVLAKELSTSYRNLSAPELEALKTTAEANRATNKASHASWIESYPPEAIYLANIARARLVRAAPKKHISLLKDGRLPSRPPSAWVMFFKARHGDIGSEATQQKDVFRALAEAWKTLPESEKRPYLEQAEVESLKHKEEIEAFQARVKAYRVVNDIKF